MHASNFDLLTYLHLYDWNVTQFLNKEPGVSISSQSLAVLLLTH